jgi:hypothetical protein
MRDFPRQIQDEGKCRPETRKRHDTRLHSGENGSGTKAGFRSDLGRLHPRSRIHTSAHTDSDITF